VRRGSSTRSSETIAYNNMMKREVCQPTGAAKVQNKSWKGKTNGKGNEDEEMKLPGPQWKGNRFYHQH
jgi:hypothetical protein